jgi:hydroxyquinol 1,2-dioxygenase
MRTVSPETLTDTLLGLSGPDTDPRLQEVLTALIRHLHAFTKEVGLTHDEWRKGLELLTRAGEMTDDERNEFVLFSDVLGLSSLVDMINSPDGCTSSSVLGPFHVLGAPELPVGGDMIGANDGPQVVVEGHVRDQSGQPIEGAKIELWQTADNGLYSNQDPGQSEYNLRISMVTGTDGRYAMSTIRPAPTWCPMTALSVICSRPLGATHGGPRICTSSCMQKGIAPSSPRSSQATIPISMKTRCSVCAAIW